MNRRGTITMGHRGTHGGLGMDSMHYVSLALSGKGSGWNLGVAFGAFISE